MDSQRNWARPIISRRRWFQRQRVPPANRNDERFQFVKTIGATAEDIEIDIELCRRSNGPRSFDRAKVHPLHRSIPESRRESDGSGRRGLCLQITQGAFHACPTPWIRSWLCTHAESPQPMQIHNQFTDGPRCEDCIARRNRESTTESLAGREFYNCCEVASMFFTSDLDKRPGWPIGLNLFVFGKTGELRNCIDVCQLIIEAAIFQISAWIVSIGRLASMTWMRLSGRAASVRNPCAELGAVIVTLAFHAVLGSLQPLVGGLRGHVEQEDAVGVDAVGGDSADGADGVDVEAPGVPLVDDVGEQVAVGDDDLFCCEARADHFVDKLSAGRHVEEHLRATADRQVVAAVEQNFTDRVADGCAARVAAIDDFVTGGAQRVAKQTHLRRFAYAVDAVEGEEHGKSLVVGR